MPLSIMDFMVAAKSSGSVPFEISYYGQNAEERQQIYAERLELILKAFTVKTLNWKGRYDQFEKFLRTFNEVTDDEGGGYYDSGFIQPVAWVTPLYHGVALIRAANAGVATCASASASLFLSSSTRRGRSLSTMRFSTPPD